MKKCRKLFAAVSVILVLALSVSACGSSDQSSSTDYNYAATEASDDYDPESYGAEAKAYDSEEYENSADLDMTAEKGAGEGGEEIEAADSEQKLVYTCWMTIQTLEFTETQQAVKDAVKKVGGIVESEQLTDSDSSWYYYDSTKRSGTLSSNLTIRVPSARYEEFLGLLEGAEGKVTNKSQNVENITKRYNDQTIYIESLETQEKRLLEMMEKAETVEDMITVESRLTDVQTELNQARSTLASMDTDVKYSTVNLSLVEVVRYTDTPKTPLTFGERITDAFADSWANFIELIQGLIIGLIYLLPLILAVGIIAVIVIFANRAWRKKHPKVKKEKKPEKHSYDNRRFFRGPSDPMPPHNEIGNQNIGPEPGESENPNEKK